MVYEPRPQRSNRAAYQGRWRPWYPSIADWMLANPGGRMEDCAKAMNRSVNTISLITNTDMFRDYFAQRREEWTRQHDHAIIHRVTRVAEKSLDLMLEKLDKQGDKIPMNLVTEVATSALDRLGYAPKPPGSHVEVNVNTGNRVVMVPISAGALEEARDAIRAAEARRTIEHHELEAEPEPEAMASGETQAGNGDPPA